MRSSSSIRYYTQILMSVSPQGGTRSDRQATPGVRGVALGGAGRGAYQVEDCIWDDFAYRIEPFVHALTLLRRVQEVLSVHGVLATVGKPAPVHGRTADRRAALW